MAQSEIILGGLPYGADIVVGEELEVGTFTIGGTTYTRYVKVVDCGAAPNTLSSNLYYKQVDVGSNFVGLLNINGTAFASTYQIPLPMINLANDGYSFDFYVDTSLGKIVIRTKSDVSTNYPKILAILEYYR